MGQKNRAFLVTGGAGFLGSHLVLHLLKCGYEVAIFDHAPSKSPFYDSPNIKIIASDTRVSNAIDSVIENYDVCIHMAGQVDVRKSIENPFGDADNNIMGAINVLEACRKHNKIAVYTSSASVYGKRAGLPLKENASCVPMSPYGQSKLCAENYFGLYNSLYGVKTISLRIFNIAGPLKLKGVFHDFADALVNKKPITIYGDGEQSRDFIPVSDVVDAIMLATETSNWGQVYNIGTGKPTTVNQLLKMFKSFSDGNGSVHYVNSVKGEIKASYADISKAREGLDWKPKTSLEEEVDRIMVWAKNGMNIQAWKDLHGID